MDPATPTTAILINSAPNTVLSVPPSIAQAGASVAERFLEFFAANIRNPNTRIAYARAVRDFFIWTEQFGLTLDAIRPLHVAAYVEQLAGAAPTVKQHLAAIRMLFNWLVTGGMLSTNPAAAVRGPKHVVKVGKTPVLQSQEARDLLESIPADSIAGLRDRALIAVMLYSFARVSALVGMAVEDYYQQGRRCWFRLHEKGGKYHPVPAHHKAEEYVDAYLEAAAVRPTDKRLPLFRTINSRRKLTIRRMDRREVWEMIKRRARTAGLPPEICCHSCRATGITSYLENGGTLEKAQQIAAHESPKTTKLYDRTVDPIMLREIEKIGI
jgi:site-specific recombinase XerD